MQFFKDIIRIFFPNVCVNCGDELIKQENSLCLKCLAELPITHFIACPDNPVEKAFYGRIPIHFAAAYLYYHPKGLSQKLIYALKYKGKQAIGELIAAQVLVQLNTCSRFPSIDAIIPVPLHPKKMRDRGYNQLTTFGQGLAVGLETKFDPSVLKRTSITETQTKKKRLERFKNVTERFVADPNKLSAYQHLLLIDDVMTTGATLEACALALLTSEVKISILTMAFTE